MKNKLFNWLVNAFVFAYFALLIGLFLLIKANTLLPLILLITIPVFCYLIYKEKIPRLTYKDSSVIIFSLFFVIIILAIVVFAKPYVYESYLAQFVTDGKMVTEKVTVEADEGPATWEEVRTFWRPNTESGETAITLIGWTLTVLCIGSLLVCIKYYVLAKKKAGETD